MENQTASMGEPLSLLGWYTLHSSLGVAHPSSNPARLGYATASSLVFWASRALFRVGATHAVSPPLGSAAFHGTNQPPRKLLSCELKCPRSAFQFPLCSGLYLIWSVQQVLCLLRIFRLIAHPDSARAEHRFTLQITTLVFVPREETHRSRAAQKPEALLPNF